jgi:spermidine synthase
MGTQATSQLQPTDSTLFLGVALTSFSALLLELALTRLFSVVLFYHFAFLAISVALLGLGAGGVFAYLCRNWLTRFATRPLAAALCTINAVAIFLALEVVLHVPVSLELSRWNFLRLTALYLASAVPFFFTGLIFSVVFARETHHVTRLYGADLLGGALACLAVVPLLNWVGGPNAILFSALTMSVAAMIWRRGSNTARQPDGRGRPSLNTVAPKIAAAILVALILANHSGRLIDVIYAKGLIRDRSWVEFARWNAISRVEVDRQGSGKAVVIDADASTYVMNCDLRTWKGSEWEHNLMSAPPALANVLRPHGEFAIIGPGGGVDVLRAVANGSPSVTGIEINPLIANAVMRGRYADYAYHLYERPDVHIHVTDGRSFIRNSREQYDVIQMTLVDTWASTAAGAFALSENSLYTADAFREYFQHLKPDGMIAITRWEFRQPREALRVVSVAMEALHELGVANPAAHFMVVSEGELDEDGIPVVVLTKKTPFTPAEEDAVQQHLARYEALDSLYLPSEPEKNPFSALIAANDPWAFARNYPYNVAPVFDNAPFFFFTLKTNQILNEESLQQGIDWKVNLGVVVLGMVLVISLVAVLAFLILPMLLGAGGTSLRRVSLLYFVTVGLGYILVEIAFIQRFVLFLGHPTYALTVVIFLLLLSSGAGSLISRRWLRQPQRVWRPLVLLVVAISAYVIALPPILTALVGLPFVLKLAVSGLLLIPLGLAMGMPFPTGLRALAGVKTGCVGTGLSPVPAEQSSAFATDNAVEWAWAMNAASSVFGSVLAMVIAIHWGLNVTLACGAAAYLFSIVLSRTLTRSSFGSVG